MFVGLVAFFLLSVFVSWSFCRSFQLCLSVFLRRRLVVWLSRAASLFGYGTFASDCRPVVSRDES